MVVGAGVAGLGVATALAENGKKVLVISRQIPGESSPASAGILDPFLEMKPGHPLFSLCRTAFQNYPSFLKKINARKAGYQKTGMLYVATTPEEERELKKRYSWQKKTGIPVKLVSREQALKQHPDISSEIRAGLFYPTIPRVQPRKLVKVWNQYAKRLGIRFIESDKKVSLLKSKGQVQGIQVGSVTYETPLVVQATGAWGEAVSKGVRLPVLPARGQILKVRGKLRIGTIVHTLNGGYVVPWGKNQYLVGSNVEFCGFKAKVTPKVLRDIWQRNCKILPALNLCKRVETWAGLRPFSQKRVPLVGATHVKGLYLAAGYYRSGILMSAYAGKLLAKGMISGKMPALLKPFQPRKFGL